jgi:hypothetical protein
MDELGREKYPAPAGLHTSDCPARSWLLKLIIKKTPTCTTKSAYIYIYVYIYAHIYIYRERETERDIDLLPVSNHSFLISIFGLLTTLTLRHTDTLVRILIICKKPSDMTVFPVTIRTLPDVSTVGQQYTKCNKFCFTLLCNVFLSLIESQFLFCNKHSQTVHRFQW